MKKKDFLTIILISFLIFSSCARHKHKISFQPDFTEKEKGDWSYPLPKEYQKITSPFGEMRRKENITYNHKGIDIKADKGTYVFAVQRGIVIYAGKAKDYGLLVCIEHPGHWKTRYAHLSSISVKLNQRVKKGQLIGRVGATGNATGPHLHFELRKNGKPINPIIIFPNYK